MNKSQEQIWIISNIFYPSKTSTGHIMTEISNHFKVKKYQLLQLPVKLLAKKLADEKIKITRIKQILFKKNNLIIRLINDIIYSISVFFLLSFNLKKGHKIFTVTNPPFLLFTIYLLKKLK